MAVSAVDQYAENVRYLPEALPDIPLWPLQGASGAVAHALPGKLIVRMGKAMEQTAGGVWLTGEVAGMTRMDLGRVVDFGSGVEGLEPGAYVVVHPYAGLVMNQDGWEMRLYGAVQDWQEDIEAVIEP